MRPLDLDDRRAAPVALWNPGLSPKLDSGSSDPLNRAGVSTLIPCAVASRADRKWSPRSTPVGLDGSGSIGYETVVREHG